MLRALLIGTLLLSACGGGSQAGSQHVAQGARTKDAGKVELIEMPVDESPVGSPDDHGETSKREPAGAKHPDPKQTKEPDPTSGELPEIPTRKDITSAIQPVKVKILGCGEKHGVTGMLKLTIKVEPDGTPSSVTTKITPDQKVDACAIDAAKTLRLPRSTKGITFTYPIVL
jgi:hypothetical protein